MADEKTGIVYLITNLQNGCKVYVGQTVQKLSERWQAHKRNAVKGINTPLYHAIRKYGPDAFTVEELCSVPKDWLSAVEVGFIKALGTFGNGYNATPGGDGMPAGKDNPLFGKKPSDAARARMSAAQAGRSKSAHHRAILSVAATGKIRSKESRRKQTATIAINGRKFSAESLAKRSATRRGKKLSGSSQYIGVFFYKRNNKWTAKLKLDGKLKHIGTYDTEIEAAQARDAKVIELGLPHPLNFALAVAVCQLLQGSECLSSKGDTAKGNHEPNHQLISQRKTRKPIARLAHRAPPG